MVIRPRAGGLLHPARSEKENLGMEQNASMVRAKANRGGEATFKAIGAGQAVCGRVFHLSRLTGGWLGSRVTAWALALVLLAPALCPAQFSGPDAAPGPFVPAQPGALDFSQTNQPVTDQVIAARAAAAAQLAAATNAALGTPAAPAPSWSRPPGAGR